MEGVIINEYVSKFFSFSNYIKNSIMEMRFYYIFGRFLLLRFDTHLTTMLLLLKAVWDRFIIMK